MSKASPTTIGHHLNAWLSIRKESKSPHTFEASKSAAKAFLRAVGNIPLSQLNEEHYSRFLRALKIYDVKTEQLYSTLIFGWFEYLNAKEIKAINISKVKYARTNEQRHPGKRLRKFDRDAIKRLQQAVVDIEIRDDDLPLARAKTLVVLAIDSGLRVHELCKLRVRDLDFDVLEGTVIGKRDKERRFPFTDKSTAAIRSYLAMRRRLEPDRGRELDPAEVPIFVSHSKRGYSKLEPMDTDTAGLDVARLVALLVGTPKSPITPHVLRHYAGNELRKATGDLEIVRILLGQESVETTQGYMHVEDEEALEVYHRKFDHAQD